MSQAYASNAESVKDYLKDYTDEQINTMGEMVSSEQNMAMQEWRNKAEQIRAAKELTLEESGELLGGIVGIKGIGKGISKVKDLYKKGQEAKKAAEELKNKVKEAAQKGKDATEKIKKDLEDKSKSKSQKSKEDNDPENDEGDLDGDVGDAVASAADDADTEAAEQEGSKDVDDGEGDTKDAPEADTGGDTAAGDTAAGDAAAGDAAAGDAAAGDAAPTVEELGSLFTGLRGRMSAMRKKLQEGAEDKGKTQDGEGDSGEPPSTEQEGAAEDAEEALSSEPGDVSGVNLDDIFSQDLGGTEEGLKTLGSGISRVVAKVGGRFTQRIGDGAVEDVLTRPTRTTLNEDSAPTQETDFGGNTETDEALDQPDGLLGGELQVYKNTAPTSYVEEGRTFQSGSSSAYKAAEGKDLTADSLDQGGSTSLGSTVVTADKTLDIDTPQPDALAPEPESTELDTLGGNAETGENALESITTTLEGGGAAALKTVGESLSTALGAKGLGGGGLSNLLGKGPDVVAEPLVNEAPDSIASRVSGLSDDIGESAGSLNEYASKIIGRMASKGASIRKVAESVYGKVKKTITEEPEESGGGESKDDDEDGEEEDLLADDAAEEVGSGALDVALGAVPVLGEALGIGYALYSGVEDLFGGSSSPPPPKTKTLGTTIAGGNPLDLGGDAMGSMLATGINTTESAIDQSGSLSF